jgi:hypothetical protein
MALSSQNSRRELTWMGAMHPRRCPCETTCKTPLLLAPKRAGCSSKSSQRGRGYMTAECRHDAAMTCIRMAEQAKVTSADTVLESTCASSTPKTNFSFQKGSRVLLSTLVCCPGSSQNTQFVHVLVVARVATKPSAKDASCLFRDSGRLEKAHDMGRHKWFRAS